MSENFDLDVTFDEQEPDLSHLSESDLLQAVESLPEALRGVAMGLLVEKRTMSDVSQELAIRQAELVTRLRRAKQIIAG
jgi:DNA-directed RNA polymerase specialized sigma24 family protein